jgi:hypothetical protein
MEKVQKTNSFDLYNVLPVRITPANRLPSAADFHARVGTKINLSVPIFTYHR